MKLTPTAIGNMYLYHKESTSIFLCPLNLVLIVSDVLVYIYTQCNIFFTIVLKVLLDPT